MKDRCEQDRKAALRRLKVSGAELHLRRWEQHIWRRYKLTPHDVALLWDRQDGLCVLCDEPLNGWSKTGKQKVWVIDHDHKTERVRGLLHAWCNHRVLSMIERAGYVRTENALEYLWPRPR